MMGNTNRDMKVARQTEGMMDPVQMHNMMKVHTDEMRSLFDKLDAIESLLSELVELQKKGGS
jgi:hypothetical protein